MGMMKCPECGKDIPENVESCPECGYVFDEIKPEEEQKKITKRGFGKKKYLILLIVAVFSIVICSVYVKYAVPNVTNMELSKATEILDDYGIPYITVSDYTDDYDKGIVFSQSIKAHTLYTNGEKMRLGVSKGKNYTMPDVVGKNIQEVKEQIKDLPIEILYEYTDNIEKDIVEKTTVEAGEIFRESSKAKITVSRGTYKKVPDIKGINVDEAETKLNEAGLTYKIVEKYCDVEKGMVYKYKPDKYGEYENIEITLYVSKGPGVEVPNVRGESLETAKKKLSDAGFSYKVEYEYSDLTTAGDDSSINNVADQNVSGRVDAPCEVTLTVKNPVIKIDYVSLDTNYVGGIDTYVNFKNISDKQIAYVVFNMRYYDRMGYPASCTIKGTDTANLEYTGPLNARTSAGKQYWDAVIYNSSVAAVMPKSATITFTDNTKQVLKYTSYYWYSNGYYGGTVHD